MHIHVCIVCVFCVHCRCIMCLLYTQRAICKGLVHVCIVCVLLLQREIYKGPRVHQDQIGPRRAPLVCISRSLLLLKVAPQCVQCTIQLHMYCLKQLYWVQHALVCISRSLLLFKVVPQCVQWTGYFVCNLCTRSFSDCTQYDN